MLSFTLRQLEYATAVARNGGMTAAAQALNVSQPALSVALAQLETLLGKPLFMRRAGGALTPTAFGRGWLEQVEAHLQSLVQLTDASQSHDEVILAVFEDLAPACLAPLLAKASRELPHLRVEPQVMGFEQLSDALRRGRVDMALTWDLGLESSIARRELARVAPQAVLPPDHHLAAHANLVLQDLTGQPLILANQGLSIGHMRALFAQKGLTMQIRYRTASLELMRSYVANGLGIGLSYTHPASQHSHDGKPVVLRPLQDAGTEPLILAHDRQNPLTNAAQALAALLPCCLPQGLRTCC